MKTFHVISLERTPERLSQFCANNTSLHVEHFPAIDGFAHPPEFFLNSGIVREGNSYSSGALGAAMSHVELWKRCVARQEVLNICEDDVVLRPDAAAIMERLLLGIRDWDFVLWGYNPDWPVKQHVPELGAVVIQPCSERPSGEGATGVSSNVCLYPLVSAAGLPCYSISPAGAAKFLHALLPIGSVPACYVTKPHVAWHNSGIDVELTRHYVQHRCFVAFPPVALPPNNQDESTIRGHLAAMHDPRIANRAIV